MAKATRLASLLFTMLIGCDGAPAADADAGTLSCAEAAWELSARIAARAADFQSCAVDADCVLLPVSH